MHTIDPDTGLDFVLRWSEELATDLRQLDQDRCTHVRTELRRFIVKGGATQYWPQCVDCGDRIGKSIGKAMAPEHVADADEEMHPRYIAERDRKREELIQKHVRIQKRNDDQRTRDYAAYLTSPIWKAKRDKVLKRARGICEGCLEATATEVHHLTYNHIFDELLFELVAVCESCHAKCHPEKLNPIDGYDEHPCCGCRWFDGSMHCGYFDIETRIALADDEWCGKSRKGHEPLR